MYMSTVLDERTDRRVDEMMERGLMDELSQFHVLYNEQRLSAERYDDTTLPVSISNLYSLVDGIVYIS